jgi:hypothetical protein
MTLFALYIFRNLFLIHLMFAEGHNEALELLLSPTERTTYSDIPNSKATKWPEGFRA